MDFNLKMLGEQSDKQLIINQLTNKFNYLLEEFKFPKLDYGYIDGSNYLPYVRGRKYNDLGSLGGVTLIIMTYYLSILEVE